MSQGSNGLPPTLYCKCGLLAMLNTSWTDTDPDRRFFECPNYGNGDACKYFIKAEGHVCTRGKELMPSLLTRLRRKDSQINLKDRYNVLEAKYKGVCVVT